MPISETKIFKRLPGARGSAEFVAIAIVAALLIALCAPFVSDIGDINECNLKATSMGMNDSLGAIDCAYTGAEDGGDKAPGSDEDWLGTE